jgi:hypothetical protein
MGKAIANTTPTPLPKPWPKPLPTLRQSPWIYGFKVSGSWSWGGFRALWF